MLKIEREYNGFKVLVSEVQFGHYTLHAKDAAEVGQIVVHYYEGGSGHAGENPNCPSCRRVKEVADKSRRKRVKVA